MKLIASTQWPFNSKFTTGDNIPVIESEQMTTTNTEIPEQILLKTLRFKFSEEVMEQIFVFAKIHANDYCKTFKESWNEWLMDVDNKTLINNETERVNALGFK